MHKRSLAVAIVVAMLATGAASAADSPSAALGLADPSLANLVIAETPDTAKFIAEDAKAVGGPLRYGVAAELEAVTFANGHASHGEVLRVPGDLLLWRVPISSPGAVSLDFEFSTLALSAGSELWITEAKREVVRGPITGAELAGSTRFFSALMPGDVAFVEVLVPRREARQTRVEIGSVTHGYRGVMGVDDGLPKSGSCNVDVVCSLGDSWRDQIDSVGHYTFRRGGSSFVCTGSLIANTSGDTRPLFLTANHCLSTQTVADSVVVYWNYQSSTCRAPGSSSSGTPLDRSIATHNQSGSTLLSTNAASDFALLRLATVVPADSNPFWSGWDRSGNVPGSAISIHHPAGHEMRISQETSPLSAASYLGGSGSGTSHWRVADWDQGTTEGGSSGSGLWDGASKLLVGQLHGGYAACGNNDADWYGRLSVSWAGGGTSATRLSNHLDPTTSGATTRQGYRAGSTPPPPPPPPGGVFENTNDFAINDRSTVESPIAVSGRTGNAPAALSVSVRIIHTYISDLRVELVAANGTAFLLHNRTGGSADNIIQSYTVNASAIPANGTWRLRVSDNVRGDIGRIDSWRLTF